MPSKRMLWLAITVFAVAFVARLVPGPRTIDDAYITFRYARNLLASDGFVFNPGERVLGTTTPLFTLILTGFALLTGGDSAPFPLLALMINAFVDAASCVLLLLIGNRLGSELAGLGAAAAWAIAPFSVTFAIGGLETSLYVLILLGTFFFYLGGLYKLSALFSALAILTRPDALLLILPLIVDRVILATRRGEPRPSWHEIALFSVPLLLWGSFAWLYFGSPFPQSVIAKSAAYRLPEFSALVRFLQHYATPFLEHLSFGLGWIGIGLILYPFLSLVGLRVSTKKAAAVWPFFVFPWVYLAAFTLANPLVFRWYLTPPLPFLFLSILFGGEHLIKQSVEWLGERFTFRPSAFFAICSILLVLLPFLLQLNGWTLIPEHGPGRPAPEMAWIELELLYEEVAAQVQNDYASTLAAGDVGVLGYFTNMTILDLVGLNSPQTSDYLPLEPDQYADFVYAVTVDLILEEMPEYVVILEIYGRESLLREAAFISRYDLIDKLPTNIYNSDGLLLFKAKK